MKPKAKRQHRLSRHKRVRAKIQGSSRRPRIAVFKSSQYIYAQVIDDEAGKTLVSVSNYGGKPSSRGHSTELSRGPQAEGKSKIKTKVDSASSLRAKKAEAASKVGEALAEKMKKAGISEAVFDRGGFKFHGRIKALAEGLRKGGIKL